MRAVLWDLDGTLVDSVADIARAIDRMLVRTGRSPLGEARVRRFVGEGAKKLVDQCVTAAGGAPTRSDLEAFLAAYRADPVVSTQVYDGVREVLEAVTVPQAVVTNKPEELSRTILHRLELSRYFAVVIGGDTLPVRKPDPAVVRLALTSLGADSGVLVGDGPADVGAGAAAGMPVFGVDWGIGRPDGAELRFQTPKALLTELQARGLAR